MNVLLRIDYGPYNAFGVITHRIQRIRGLINSLTQLGYKLEVYEIGLLNRLQIMMYDRKIFQCDIRHLKFNMEYEDDIVCQTAVAVVEEAAQRICHPNALSSVPVKKNSTVINIHDTDEYEYVQKYLDEKSDVSDLEESYWKNYDSKLLKFSNLALLETQREMEKIREKELEDIVKEGLKEASTHQISQFQMTTVPQ